MSLIKIPYFDKRKAHSKTFYTDNKLQKYIALFLSNPDNYSDVINYTKDYRESIFMYKFINFVSDYVNIDYEKDFDTFIYFRALNIDTKGAMNITGGSGSISNSGRKQFLREYSNEQEINKKIRQYLTDKYMFDFNPTLPDPRIFIGHQEIWKSPSPELLKLENWEWVIDKSYNDLELEKPLPIELDGDLIPLSIRNKALQKWKNEKRKRYEIEMFKKEQLAKKNQANNEEEDFIKEVKVKIPSNKVEEDDW